MTLSEFDCAVETAEDGPEEGHGIRWPYSGAVSRPAVKAALAFKEKYGEMRYSQANKLIAGEFVRGYLREHYPDLRVVDRVTLAPYAVEWCLVPLLASCAAAELGRDRALEERRAQVSAPR